MDTTQKLTHIGLCAGYGGIELGLKRVIQTLRTVALCEIEAFACANLVAKMEAGLMDPAPIWSDLKTFPWAEFRDRVDILTGGYPCQPFSAAGQRRGTDDPRHLWPWIADGIRAMRPRVCFFENVEGHITLGLSTVISDLEEMGYRATWGIFSASECLDASGRTAPHQRKRVFVMAVAGGIGSAAGISGSLAGNEGKSGVADNYGAQDIWPSRPGEPQYAWEPPRVVGNTTSGARLGRASGEEGHVAQPDEGVGDTSNARRQGGRGANDPRWQVQRSAEPDRSGSNGEMESGQRQAEPALGGDTHGDSSGLDDAIVFTSDCQPCELCGEPICPRCNEHYAECPCPGPNSNND